LSVSYEWPSLVVKVVVEEYSIRAALRGVLWVLQHRGQHFWEVQKNQLMKILYVQTIVRLQYDTGPELSYRPVSYYDQLRLCAVFTARQHSLLC